jgi:rifampicin phosphotransferase
LSYLVWPEDSAIDPSLLGGKGAGLWRLLKNGLPVPPVFCLTTEAYDVWLRAGRPDELPIALRIEVDAAVKRLAADAGRNVRFAVRSSATGEDSSVASFAGQLQTRLNVAPIDVPTAIMEIWRSLDRATVAAYRKHLGIAAGRVAVLIQVLVPAESSGVVFTADPLTGESGRLIVNGAWGMGEAIVDGLVTPDHWVVDRASGRILEARIAEKDLMVVPSSSSGTTLVATIAENVARPILSETQIGEVVALALRAEVLAGTPQDVEWAFANGRFVFLQARPVTARPAPGEVSEFDSEIDPSTVWTSANIQEVLPGLVTPLTWSGVRDGLNDAFRAPFLEIGAIRDSRTVFVGSFYSRLFLNVSALRSMADRMIGTSPEAIDEQYLGTARGPNQPRRQPLLRRLWAYRETTPKLLRLMWQLPGRVEQVERQLQAFLDQERGKDLRAASLAELVATMDRATAECPDVGGLHISTSIGASVAFEMLSQSLRKWFGAEAAELSSRLITGMNDVASAVPGLEIWRLARLATRDSGLRSALDATDPWVQIEQLDGEAAVEFRRELADFLSRYGHRSVMEGDVAATPWAEDPNAVLVLVANFVDLPPEAEPRLVAARQRAIRLTTTEAIERRLDPVRRLVFRFVLAQAQRYVSLRERTKSMLMEISHYFRQFTRALERHFHQQGLLADPRDLYFLTYPEVRQIVELGPEGMGLEQRIRRRKAEYERNRSIQLPESFVGRPQPLAEAPDVPASEKLSGIPVSPGIATGRARVILDPRQSARIEPGEILVAPVTDAGWTPLFLVASGLVVDIGGPLSHGSTVAREYGLPAVVNVKVGTRLIQTGRTITVNGSTGDVFIHDE